MSNVIRDVHFAARRLRQSPMFTTAAALTLTLAIAGTTSVFSLVDGILLKPWPIHDPDRVMTVVESSPSRGLAQFAVAPANYLDWRAQNTAFTDLAASWLQQFNVVGTPEPQRLDGFAVTPNFFSVVGVTPALGRPLASDSSGVSEAVIAYGLWQREFGGASSVLGRTLTLNDHPYTVVGVMPRGLPTNYQIWTRLTLRGSDQTERGAHYLSRANRTSRSARRSAPRVTVSPVSSLLRLRFSAPLPATLALGQLSWEYVRCALWHRPRSLA